MANPIFPSDLVRIVDSLLLLNDRKSRCNAGIIPPDCTEIKDFSPGELLWMLT